MHKVKVSSKGQLVIPQKLREEFDIGAGKEVFIDKTESGILIMPKAEDVLNRIIEFAKKNPVKITKEEIKQARKEWKRD